MLYKRISENTKVSQIKGEDNVHWSTTIWEVLSCSARIKMESNEERDVKPPSNIAYDIVNKELCLLRSPFS